MAWKITLVGGAEMAVTSTVRVPGGTLDLTDPAVTLNPGDLVCLFPDGHMTVEVELVEEIV